MSYRDLATDLSIVPLKWIPGALLTLGLTIQSGEKASASAACRLLTDAVNRTPGSHEVVQIVEMRSAQRSARVFKVTRGTRLTSPRGRIHIINIQGHTVRADGW